MEEASPPQRRGLFRFREPRTSIIQLRGHRQIVDTEIGRSIYVLADEVELDLVHPAQRRQVDIRPLVAGRRLPDMRSVASCRPKKNGLTAAGLLQIFTAFPFDPMERRTSLRNLRVAKVGKKFYLCAR